MSKSNTNHVSLKNRFDDWCNFLRSAYIIDVDIGRYETGTFFGNANVSPFTGGYISINKGTDGLDLLHAFSIDVPKKIRHVFLVLSEEHKSREFVTFRKTYRK